MQYPILHDQLSDLIANYENCIASGLNGIKQFQAFQQKLKPMGCFTFLKKQLQAIIFER